MPFGLSRRTLAFGDAPVRGTTLSNRLNAFSLSMNNYAVPPSLKYSNAQELYEYDPVVKTMIDTHASYVLKDEFDIIDGNDKTRGAVEDYFDNIAWQDIAGVWLRESKVFGIGVLEMTDDDLYNRPASTMEAQIDPRTGQIDQWIQKPNKTDETTWRYFDPDELIILKNGGFADSYYGISDVSAIDYIIRRLKDPAERSLIVTLEKYAGERYEVTIGSEGRPVSPDRYSEVADYFSNLQMGEDIIHRGDIIVDTLSPQTNGMDFAPYLEYILSQISVGLNVPLVFWIAQGSTEATAKIQLEAFEATIKSTRASIEWAINNQIIPRIVPGEDYPKFKFRPINLQSEFLGAQIDQLRKMGDLNTGLAEADEDGA